VLAVAWVAAGPSFKYKVVRTDDASFTDASAAERRYIGARLMLHVLQSATPPWGDYGSILWHGLADHTDGHRVLQVCRPGPFVPPISFPWPAVVMTSALVAEFSRQQFTGCDVRSVVLKKAVFIDWRSWDPVSDEPAELPVGW
jgi:hypothetical protein